MWGDQSPFKVLNARLRNFGEIARHKAGRPRHLRHGVVQRDATHFGNRYPCCTRCARKDVLKVIIKQGIIISLIGVAIGLAAAFALTRLLFRLLVGVSSTDLTIFGGVTLMLLVITLLGSFIPARRATKIDPLIALRTE